MNAKEWYEREHLEVLRLREAILGALDELGVPGPGYPAPVANAVEILTKVIQFDGEADGR